jgi:hypothetical protein
MKSITIANVVFNLTLTSESEVYGNVYKGRIHDVCVTVVLDDMPRVSVSSADLGAIGYMIVQHNGFNLCKDSENIYSFVFKL